MVALSNAEISETTLCSIMIGVCERHERIKRHIHHYK